MTSNPRTWVVLVSSTLLLAACDLPFLVDEQTRIDAKREAEGKAVGSACRHAGRALEECYERSPKTSKAAIFAGWRDMDGYMRENNIQIVSPDMPEAPPAKQSQGGEAKPKTAEAPAEEKPKTAEAGAKPVPEKKSAEAPALDKKKAAEAPPPAKKTAETSPLIKQGMAVPAGGKVLKHVA